MMTSVLRSVTALTILMVALTLGAAPADAAGGNPKYAAIVVHADSGDVLFDRYSDQRRYPASLTKMMTLYLLFEEIEAGRLALNGELSVSAQAAGQPPSKLGVAAGSKIDVETAIQALVVKSANDVAVVVAEGISGSEWKFAQAMTSKAHQIGMRNTTFKNASGLPNSKQTTTARDLAILSRRLIQDFPQYFPYFSAREFTWNGNTYRTHNALVKSFDGADGLKTGYTQRSGFNLATTAARDNNRLIGVVLGGRSVRSRDAHMREILTAGFEKIKNKPTLIAALHRNTPSPRLKPTLIAQLAIKNPLANGAENGGAAHEAVVTMADGSPVPTAAPGSTDRLGALIAAADSDDFNEFERVRLLASAADEGGNLGEGDIEDSAGWSVQIGAYSSKTLAQRELESAAVAADLINRTRVVTPITKEDGAILYRARFTRLTEADATATCTRIRASKLNCFALQEVSAP